jgi:hypothetical protein
MDKINESGLVQQQQARILCIHEKQLTHSNYMVRGRFALVRVRHGFTKRERQEIQPFPAKLKCAS